MIENIMLRENLQNKFINYFKYSEPQKASSSLSKCKKSNRKSTFKDKGDIFYTQISSNRQHLCKTSMSNHISPGKAKDEKLFKTSTMNYLQKCRSEYEEKSAKHIVQSQKIKQKNSNHLWDSQMSMYDQTFKSSTLKKQLSNLTNKVRKPRRESQSMEKVFDRTQSILQIYKKKCINLERQKDRYRIELGFALNTIKELERGKNKLRNFQISQSRKSRLLN